MSDNKNKQRDAVSPARTGVKTHEAQEMPEKIDTALAMLEAQDAWLQSVLEG